MDPKNSTQMHTENTIPCQIQFSTIFNTRHVLEVNFYSRCIFRIESLAEINLNFNNCLIYTHIVRCIPPQYNTSKFTEFCPLTNGCLNFINFFRTARHAITVHAKQCVIDIDNVDCRYSKAGKNIYFYRNEITNKPAVDVEIYLRRCSLKHTTSRKLHWRLFLYFGRSLQKDCLINWSLQLLSSKLHRVTHDRWRCHRHKVTLDRWHDGADAKKRNQNLHEHMLK